MKIKRIEIIGFKSFVEKVSLDFQEGVTGVVGPNGCGKSNIVDAIRWAMGEQSAKNLRGRAMEDVIFGGSESRKPHGMAEVSMIFANDDGLAPPAFRDYAEIMVTRRLYRNGESEYLLNKTPCRLLDIAELFMDTGVGKRAYSIIEQGKIGMILNAKPEDRRFLIEEAAGVTKFKARKKTATRKIELTQQNLVRLGDIVSEVRRQLGSLKRQAQKAERFRQYREELKEIETVFALRRFRDIQNSLAEVAGREQGQAEIQENLVGQLDRGELQLSESKLQQVSAEKEVAGAQERVFHLGAQLQQVEGRLEFAAQQLENLERQRVRLTTEEEEVGRRLAGLDQQEADLHEEANRLNDELGRASRALVQVEAELAALSEAEADTAASMEQVRSDLFAAMNALTSLHNQQEDARRRLELLEERTARNRKEAVGLQEQDAELGRQAGELQEALAALLSKRQALAGEQDRARQSLADLRQALHSNEQELLAAREELNRSSSRLESLEQLERNLEGYASGVRTLLLESDFRQRFSGMVADRLSIPADLEVAVEAVLGERLQALLADNPEDAGLAMNFLKGKGGRSTFLLSLDPRPAPPAFAGGEHLPALLGLPPGGRGDKLSALFQGVYLVDSLEKFFGGGLPWGLTLVTRSGEVLTSRGELSGGSSQALSQGVLHKKREMKELGQRVDVLLKQVETLQEARADLQGKAEETEGYLQELAATHHAQELKVVSSDQNLARIRQEQERLQERIEVLSLEEEQLHEEEADLQRRLAEAASGHQEKSQGKQALEQSLSSIQEELSLQRRAVGDARERLTAVKVEVASLREREESGRRSRSGLENLRGELKGRLHLLQAQREESREETGKLLKESERQKAELQVLATRREEEKRAYDRLRENYDELTRRLEVQEEALRELRQHLGRVQDALNGLQLDSREKQLEREHLRQTFFDRYRVDLEQPPDVVEKDFDEQTSRKRQQDLQRQIEAIGEVNLTAIEECRQLEERHDFLAAQQEDLRKSIQGLQEAIAKINRTTRKRFREAFDQINGKFREVFPRLFRGGRAELQLTDEEDLLETGIDIIAQPPGKKLQNVSLLSGGEKALTAVALIFSIFLIKPSPFCLLDEVDAPLDDANIDRFNDMVREMSDFSQFIIITHNKRTMEIADTLYGVTMEEPGVSKLVSVRVSEF